jgi:DMSO/TMAO reductase YedYZ molybdopterin-dependent catalytic subunit
LVVIGVAAMLVPWRGANAQQTVTLKISGEVAAQLTLTLDDLKKLPERRIDDVWSIAQDGRREEQTRKYAGVLLRDVLDRAKLVEKQPRSLRRSVVIATARDGYTAVFSWAELYLSPIGDGALIVYERDGAPLPDNEGPLALVSLKDTRPGPRHVKWLQSIEVRSVAD